MRFALVHAAFLTLWRDRPALALAFVLPAAIFAIFALVFSSASGGGLKIRLAVAAAPDEFSQTFAKGLIGSEGVSEIVRVKTESELARALRDGRADAGVEIAYPEESDAPIISFYADATRGGAALIAESALLRLAPKTDEAEAAMDGAKRVVINPVNAKASMAAYFAAGVAMLFLALSGFQNAQSLIEERDAGIMHRIATGRAGLAAAVDARFLFLFAQGFAQIAVILATAALAFRVDLGYAPLALALAAVAAAAGSAGIVLAVVMVCRSRAQAHAVGAVLSLVAAALGGSMAPKFLMPAAVQHIGAVTPNALGIDAFSAALWAGGGLNAAWRPVGLLLLAGLAGLLFARMMAERTLRADA